MAVRIVCNGEPAAAISSENRANMNFDDEQGVGSGMGIHLAAAKGDLQLVQELLRDAVTNLLSNALAVRVACMTQLEAARCGHDARQREALLALNREIDARSNDTIVQLQFQDRVTQLLDHAVTTIDAVDDDRGLGTFAALPRRKPVMMHDMHCGDVKLFWPMET
jgi:hypothetical protein